MPIKNETTNKSIRRLNGRISAVQNELIGENLVGNGVEWVSIQKKKDENTLNFDTESKGIKKEINYINVMSIGTHGE